jgi:hypothetical protein
MRQVTAAARNGGDARQRPEADFDTAIPVTVGADEGGHPAVQGQDADAEPADGRIIQSGGAKADIASRIKVDDLGWRFRRD